MAIPLRDFGKTGVKVSALGLGGHHLGGAKDEKTAVEIVHRALDGGITFYDNAWEYYRGKTESWLGLGLKGQRDKAFPANQDRRLDHTLTCHCAPPRLA